MVKQCTQCHAALPEGWTFPCCPYCGAQLPAEEPAAEGAPTLQVGDANAISGGVHVDSHNVVTNHVTHVERDKTPEELHQERVVRFKQLCQEAYADGRIDLREARQLEDLRLTLGLSEAEAEQIRNDVKRLRLTQSAHRLNPIARVALTQVISQAKACHTERLRASLPRLEALAEKYTDEDVQFYYHLLLSVLSPDELVNRYEHRQADNYWLAYWTFMAYLNADRLGEAEAVLDTLAMFDHQPYGNITLLATASCLYQYWSDPASAELLEQANQLFEQGCEDHSECLDRFTQVLMLLLDTEDSSSIEEYKAEFAFYFTYLFDVVMHRKQMALLHQMLPRIPKIGPLPH